MAYRTDRAQLRTDLKPPEKRPDGSTLYHGATTRAGVFEYELADGSKRREYRPPEEVSRADSLETMHLAPVVAYEHTPKGEARKRNVGTVGQDVEWVPAKKEVQASFVVRDDSVNADIAAGMQELSWGYEVDLEETPGTSPEGERYDAIQRGPMRDDGKRGPITYEHLAIVDDGRAGSSVRLRADSKNAPRPSWRTDSARMTSAAAPGGAAAINASAAARRSKDTAMADEKKNGTRADCGDMETEKKDGLMPPPGGAPPPMDPAKENEMLKAEIAKLKEQLAKTAAAQDSAAAGAAAPVARANDAVDEEDEEMPPGTANDSKARMDALVNARFKREKLHQTAKDLGLSLREDAKTTEIKKAIIEKLDGPIPTTRLDSLDGKGKVSYVKHRYDFVMERHSGAIAAERAARGGTPAPAQRHDAATDEASLQAAMVERNRKLSARKES